MIIPDEVVMTALIAEAIGLGFTDSLGTLGWACQNGYAKVVPPDDIEILDAGREHVAKRAIPIHVPARPELN